MRSEAGPWREQLAAFVKQQAQPPYKYSHQPRLYRLTQQIRAQEPGLVVDDEVVFAAAWLHDLGVFVGHRPEDDDALRTWDHVAYACRQSPQLLADLGFPLHKVAAVLDCIRQHQPKDEPHSPEATLLRDADILEQLGAIGILRTVSKVGGDTRFHTFEDARQALQTALDTLPPKLQLAAACKLAEPRVKLLQEFLSALPDEAGPHLGMQ